MHARKMVCFVAASSLALIGCTSRSISNSGPNPSGGGRYASSVSYRGELSEFDILRAVPEPAAPAGTALEKLPRGERVLLLQSGAFMPDDAMVSEMNKHFSVAPFSGLPPQENDRDGFSARLREAALRGNYRHIVCYWGMLETEHVDHATRAVSWTPIVGWMLPDKSIHTQIRVRALIMDAATGQWTMVAPEGLSRSAISSMLSRGEKDQAVIAKLKAEAYRRLVAGML